MLYDRIQYKRPHASKKERERDTAQGIAEVANVLLFGFLVETSANRQEIGF